MFLDNTTTRKLAIIVFVVSIAIYLNAIGGKFVSDDVIQIVKSQRINDIRQSQNLGDISNVLIHKIAQLNPIPYHAFNIFVHALNSALVFYFLLRFFWRGPSFVGALVFSVHPVHTEAVSWISGKPYPLAALFILSSFLLYDSASSQKKLGVSRYLASFFLHVGALFTCWYALLFPGMLVLYDILYKQWRIKWRLWLPYVLSIFAWLFVNIYFIQESIVSRKEIIGESHRAVNPILTIASSLFHNIGLLFWPMRLSFYHDIGALTSQLLVPKFCLFALILIVLPILFDKAKSLFFALCLFILYLSPTYTSFGVVSLLAERYVYFSSISLSMLAAFLLQRYALAKYVKNIVIVLLAIAIGGFSVRTIVRNNDWKEPMTLWKATVKSYPQNPKGYKNLGSAYLAKGDYHQAVTLYRKAIAIEPRYVHAYSDLAAGYVLLGEYRRAIVACNKALELKGDNIVLAELYNNLGIAYKAIGDYEQSIAALKKAIEIRPSYKDYIEAFLYYNIGVSYKALGDYDQAIVAFEKAVIIKPDYAQAHKNLAELYRRSE